MKLYECTFLDEFSETQMIICDLPTNNVKEIVEIINANGMANSGLEYMAVENGVIEIKRQDGFKKLPKYTDTIKFYHI
jgi:hypothetical protein